MDTITFDGPCLRCGARPGERGLCQDRGPFACEPTRGAPDVEAPAFEDLAVRVPEDASDLTKIAARVVREVLWHLDDYVAFGEFFKDLPAEDREALKQTLVTHVEVAITSGKEDIIDLAAKCRASR